MHAVIARANPAGANPEVAVDIGAHAVGDAGALVGDHLRKQAAVAQLASVRHIEDVDVLGIAAVDDVQLLVIGRKAEAVGLPEIGGGQVELAGLRVGAIHGGRYLGASLEALVVTQNPDRQST